MKKLIALCIPAIIAAAPMDTLVVREIAKSGYNKIQTIGIALSEVTSKELLVDFNSKGALIPASVEKIFTGAAAMDLLTPLHDFKTEIYLGEHDKLTGAVKNIAVKGFGDPGFTAEQIWLLATQLKLEGVTSLRDTLFIDNSYFDSTTMGPGFYESKSSRAYMAPVAALSVNFNSIAVHVRPTIVGEKASISLLPAQSNLKIVGSVKTVESAKNEDLNVTTLFDGKENVVSLEGVIGVADKSRIIYRKLWDPIQSFSSSFIAVCNQVGITCSLTVIAGTVPKDTKPFYTFHSRPLQDHVKDMFKYSNNFVAEMIFRTIHAEKGKCPGTWAGASEIVTNWYNKISTDTSKVPTIVNGSGMGKTNFCTPVSILDALRSGLNSDRFGHEFGVAFPVAGEDGTLSSRFSKSPLKGNLRGKTGTLNDDGVTNLAGFFSKKGKTYVYCILINNTEKTQYEHWMFQERLLSRIYDQL